MIKYSLYPTLLDSLYWYNVMPDKNYQELLDKINRVEKPMPEAAQKGVAFESLVNKVIEGEQLEVNGFNQFEQDGFLFGRVLVDNLASKLQRKISSQEFVKGQIETSIGKVELYGFIDFSYDHLYVDLKTTGKYKNGKFKNNHQHLTYPLLGYLKDKKVRDFVYLVTDFQNIYTEVYNFNLTEFTDKLNESIVSFDRFVQENKDKITNTRIYGNS